MHRRGRRVPGLGVRERVAGRNRSAASFGRGGFAGRSLRLAFPCHARKGFVVEAPLRHRQTVASGRRGAELASSSLAGDLRPGMRAAFDSDGRFSCPNAQPLHPECGPRRRDGSLAFRLRSRCSCGLCRHFSHRRPLLGKHRRVLDDLDQEHRGCHAGRAQGRNQPGRLPQTREKALRRGSARHPRLRAGRHRGGCGRLGRRQHPRSHASGRVFIERPAQGRSRMSQGRRHGLHLGAARGAVLDMREKIAALGLRHLLIEEID